MIDLRNLIKAFKYPGQRRTYGLDFSELSGDPLTAEFVGQYGHQLKDTAGGWSATGTVTPIGAAITATKALSTLASGYCYPIKASGGAISIQMDAAPTAGDTFVFEVVDNTNAITIDVDGGTATDRSHWGHDIVFPAGTSKGLEFMIRAVSDGTNVKWSIDNIETESMAVGPAITSSVNVSTLMDGILYPVNSSGGAIAIAFNETGHSGKRVSFVIIDATNAFTLTAGANTYFDLTPTYNATESLGKIVTVVSDGTKWSHVGDGPNINVLGEVRIAADNKGFYVGALPDCSWLHNGIDTVVRNTTGKYIITGVAGNVQVDAAALEIQAAGDIQGLGQLDINAVAGAEDTNGFQMDVTASAGGAASAAAGGVGGLLAVSAGIGGAGTAALAAGAGGTLRLYGGDAGADNGGVGANGGNVVITAGAASGVGAAGNIQLADTTAITGDFSYTGHKLAQTVLFNAMDLSTGWLIDPAGASMAESSGPADAWIRMPGLKVGDVITGYRIEGSTGSGGNNTVVTSRLYSALTAAGTPTVTALGAGGTLTHTIDGVLTELTETGLAITVAADTQYYMAVNGTTAAGCTIVLTGMQCTINRK